jgi:hypothetical protein
VQTATIGVAGRATWTGSAWVGGAAPLDEPAPLTPVEAYVEPESDDDADDDGEHETPRRGRRHT